MNMMRLTHPTPHAEEEDEEEEEDKKEEEEDMEEKVEKDVPLW